jgi:poly-beta-1,6-N-acetyl-D-glucosamine synthase
MMRTMPPPEPPAFGGVARRVAPTVGTRPIVRFGLALALTSAYLGLAVVISDAWRTDLEAALGPVAAWAIPVLLAYLPGFFVGFMLFSLLVLRYWPPSPDPPPGPWAPGSWPPVTVLVAALNEEASIVPTLERIADSSYAGEIKVVLADNGSTDRTAPLAEDAAKRLGLGYEPSFEPQAGKHRALNTALETVTTPLVVTLDADTCMHRDALTYLISRVTERPQEQHVSACAGCVIVENVGTDLITRMQGWDYRLGINGVKRMQASYNCTLVAQGAFSVYWTEDLRAVGGWPDAIGEDIVLTWSLLTERGLVQYEPVALSYTTVPSTLRSFIRQRARWARGMLEGIRSRPPRRQPRALAKFVASIDYLVPLLDIGLVFFWVPGVILFLFGYPLIFSWLSMLVIPITLAILALLRRWQQRNVFNRFGITVEPNRRGFIGYLLVYQIIASAAAIQGYAQHVTGAARRWR